MPQLAEERVAELELALENLLECFEETPNGLQAEDAEGGIVVLSEDIEDAVVRAADVLDREE